MTSTQELAGFAGWLDRWPWTKTLVALAALFFVVTGATLGWVTWYYLAHPAQAIDTEAARLLDVWLGHVVTFSGVSVAGIALKRATTKPDVIRAETERLTAVGGVPSAVGLHGDERGTP